MLAGAIPALAGPPVGRSIPNAAALHRAGGSRPAAVTNIDVSRRMDLDHLNMVVTNQGSFAWDIATGAAGLVYPRGSGKTAMFAGGLWVGAVVGGETRVTAAEYSFEYGSGPMVGGTFTPDQPRYLTYKVRPPSGDPQDTAHVDRSPAELTADPTLDPILHHSWSEYIKGAVPDGAPTRVWRLPNTSTPDPTDSVDVIGPDVIGDEMTWAVYNDADPSHHTNEAGKTLPLGIEVQQTTYAFNRNDALGDAIFISYKVINKGGNLLQNAYLSAWSDPDLGDFSDDLTGCSVGRGLGFCYNGQSTDAVYGSAPPAVGIVLLRGPKSGGGLLGMTAFTKYINGTDPQSYLESYNYMQGLNADGTPIIDPTTLLATHYMVNGDPQAGTGWFDSGPADRRMQLSSGPFTMALGDTQTFVVAVICAQGADRLASIGQLECESDAIRNAWASQFLSAPLAICVPTATLVSLVRADAEPDVVRLAWASASGALVASVERSEPGGAWLALGPAAADGSAQVSFEDHTVVAGRRYEYRLAIADGSATTYAGETWVDVPAAVMLALQGLRPNPAHGDLFVSFSLPTRGPARLEMTDVTGRRVFAREVGSLGPGRHVVALDSGRPLPAGVYLMRLTQLGRTVNAKAAIVR